MDRAGMMALGRAVLLQACADVAQGYSGPDAEGFDDEGLEIWSEILGIDPNVILAGLEKARQQGRALVNEIRKGVAM